MQGLIIFRQNSALTWISGISRACGALKMDISEEDDGELSLSLYYYIFIIIIR